MSLECRMMEYGAEIEAHFIIDHFENTSNFDANRFVDAMESVLCENTLCKAININTDLYTSYIDRSMRNLNEVLSVDSDKLTEFFQNTYNAFDKDNIINISISLQDADSVSKIRPQYLMEYVGTLKKCINSIIDERPGSSDEVDDFLSMTNLSKMKKQLVKTNLQISQSKDILVMDTPIIVNIDEAFILTNVIPYLRALPRLNKEIEADVRVVRLYIAKSSIELTNISNILDKLKVSGKIESIRTVRQLDKLLYNAIRNYISLSAYLTHLTIRKMNIISYNMVSYYNLYNTIHNYYPEGDKILHENAIDGKLDDIDDDILVNSMIKNGFQIVHASINNILFNKKHQIASATIALDGFDIYGDIDEIVGNHDYDRSIYTGTNRIFSILRGNVNRFITMMINGDVFDEALEQSELCVNLGDMYQDDIIKIGNISNYNDMQNRITDKTSKTDIMLRAYSELYGFKSNMDTLSSNIKKGYYYIKESITKLSNHMYDISDCSRKEMIEFLEDLLNQYKLLVLDISRKLIARIKCLSDFVTSFNKSAVTKTPLHVESDTVSNSELLEYTVDDILKSMDSDNEVMFETLIQNYKSLKSSKETGISILYEAEAPKTKTDVDSKLKQLKKFISEIIEKFNNKIRELFTKNGDWLKQNKKALLNLDTSSMTINILPYSSFDINQIGTNINQAVSKLNALNITDIYKKSQADLRKEIFPMIPTNIRGIDEKGFSSIVKTYYSIGNNKPANLTYSGDRAKLEIRKMVEYCEEYQKICSNLEKNLKTLTNAADSKLTQILNSRDVTESVLMNIYENSDTTPSVENNTVKSNETNNQDRPERAKNSSVSSNKHAQYISSDIRMFTTAVLTAVEARYVAYISVLRALIAKTKPDE